MSSKKNDWDFERAKIKKPVKAPRVVVSVAFSREDFESVAGYAGRMGKKISEFIREAALEKATKRESVTSLYGFGSAGSLWAEKDLPSATQLQTPAVVKEEREPYSTSG